MFKKNQKNNHVVLKEETISQVDSNDYVNDLFLDLNRSNFLYYSSQYIDNLMIYYNYIKEYVLKGLKGKELYRKSLNLNLLQEENTNI